LKANPVSVTVVRPDAVAEDPSLSVTRTVTVSVCLDPASPKNVPVNRQRYTPLGCRTAPVAQVPRPARLPYTSSVMDVIVTGSALVLTTRTVNVNVPPGAGRLLGLADFVTIADGRRSVIDTVALPDAVATVPPGVVAVAVTTSVWVAPAFPVKVATKAQL
jgi:hypothetical protein